jgi:catechol 2,3-dioxygenase-like lactoylglutathione lyase family enzyme
MGKYIPVSVYSHATTIIGLNNAIFAILILLSLIIFNMSNIRLGAFSVSLAVKDIHASKAFYEKLGFTYKGGNIDQNWIVLKNGNTVIGLFQGMFDKNLLTFNPGWDQAAQHLDDWDDVRVIQQHLQQQGIDLTTEVTGEAGPAHITLTDPDGNQILIDQHR